MCINPSKINGDYADKNKIYSCGLAVVERLNHNGKLLHFQKIHRLQGCLAVMDPEDAATADFATYVAGERRGAAGGGSGAGVGFRATSPSRLAAVGLIAGHAHAVVEAVGLGRA